MEMSGRTSSPGPSLGPSGHVDDFARRNLPPFEQWPELPRDRPEFQYPEYLNAAVELTERGMGDERWARAKPSGFHKQGVISGGPSTHAAELDGGAVNKPVRFDAVKTGRDDVALLGFTSGTTGEPKATMHFHRDLMIVADGYAREVLNVTPDDVFVGSPPLAFTFGLGGLAIFPLRFGATATLLENASPANMVQIIETYKATISFTAPTAYRAMMAAMDQGANLSSLRIAVSAGETLPAPVFEEWTRRTGKPILGGR